MKIFRKVLFWTHLVVGLAAGGVIAVVAFTGATMAFEKQVIAWAERDLRHVTRPTPDAPRLPLATILERVRAAQPEARPAGVIVSSDPTDPLTLSLGRTGSLYVNPYTGETQPSGAKDVRAFFRLMLTWHRWLGVSGPARTAESQNVRGVPSPRINSARETTSPRGEGTPPTLSDFSIEASLDPEPFPAREEGPPTRGASSALTARQFAHSVVGVACIVFFTLCVSGLYLWWPKKWNWRTLKTTSLVNLKLSGKARDWNWHNVVGLWSAPVLIVITFTGLIMAYREFGAWVYPRPATPADGSPFGGLVVTVPTPPARTIPLTPDTLLAIAQKEIPA